MLRAGHRHRQVRTGSIAALAVAILCGSPPASFAGQATESAQENTQPSGEDLRAERLFDQLRLARTAADSKPIADAIWNYWLDKAPTLAIREAVGEAMNARESYDFARANDILDDVVAKAPDYAEGLNQRAFIRFLREDYEGSLEDLERTLELEPRHFAALTGIAHIMFQMGRMEMAQKFLMQAVEINPWVKERGMILPHNRRPIPAEREQGL